MNLLCSINVLSACPNERELCMGHHRDTEVDSGWRHGGQRHVYKCEGCQGCEFGVEKGRLEVL